MTYIHFFFFSGTAISVWKAVYLELLSKTINIEISVTDGSCLSVTWPVNIRESILSDNLVLNYNLGRRRESSHPSFPKPSALLTQLWVGSVRAGVGRWGWVDDPRLPRAARTGPKGYMWCLGHTSDYPDLPYCMEHFTYNV